MCGIFLCASRKPAGDDAHATLFTLLDKRGPDCYALVHQNLRTTSNPVSLVFYSTVLSLRGPDVVAQPLEDAQTSSLLCWNGEAWSLGSEKITGNDAEAVFQSILTAANESHYTVGDVCASDPIINALMRIIGPFAFVFYDSVHSRIYYGRDCLGRRSLMIKSNEQGVCLSSVGDGTSGWNEVPADGVYVLHFDPSDELLARERFPLPQTSALDTFGIRSTHSPYAHYEKYHAFNHSVPSIAVPALSSTSEAINRLGRLVRQSLLLRTESIPYRAISTSPTSGRGAVHDNDIADIEQQMKLASFNASPRDSLYNQPSRVAVLFSGGLDCTVLARLLHDLLPSGEEIDLLNVAFHNPRVHGALASGPTAVYDQCPDRITARTSATELRNVCATRKWRLVEINIPYDEMLQHRDQVVSLMHPHDTEMDLSIALALYFAARGIGITRDETDHCFRAYETPARVLFSGLGADELFAGYQRHATAFTRQGFNGLLNELELDINRLGQRNLGRDDRVISHWSREARYPFLDEDLVKWAVTCPVWEKCGFGQGSNSDAIGGTVNAEQPDLEAGKKVLRLLALRLGMKNVASEKKRAIQFGARTAKMLGKSKGTQRIARDA